MQSTMNNNFTFAIKRSSFDENYNPSENTRITTNFANLARGKNRQENLRNTLVMINNRFNTLAHWDNPKSDRYSVELDIISVEMNIGSEDNSTVFPAIEILKTSIIDKKTNERIEGLSGITFPLTSVIMTLAYYCPNIIKIRHSSAFLKTLANCTGISSGISSTPVNTRPTSKSHRLSA
jgi:hypothetical protein